MKKIYLGHTKQGSEIALDFEEEGIKFILLAGQTGSGKSVFHNNLYKQLSKNYAPDEIGFIFLDNTMVDFNGWQSDKSVMGKPKEAIEALGEISKQQPKKMLFVHIEECDMVNVDRAAVEAAFEKIKGLKDVYVVYSTSRIDQEYLTNWMKRFIDIKVVFRTATVDDSNFLMGNDIANRFIHAGERALLFNNRMVLCQPFNVKEIESLRNFKLIDTAGRMNNALKKLGGFFKEADIDPVIARLGEVDIAYPSNENEYCVLGGWAVVMIVATSDTQEELPIESAYFQVVEDKTLPLEKLGVRVGEDFLADRVKEKKDNGGRICFENISFWAMPVAFFQVDVGSIAIDFKGERKRFTIMRGPWKLDDRIHEWINKHRAEKIKIAEHVPFDVVAKFIEREFISNNRVQL